MTECIWGVTQKFATNCANLRVAIKESGGSTPPLFPGGLASGFHYLASYGAFILLISSLLISLQLRDLIYAN